MNLFYLLLYCYVGFKQGPLSILISRFMKAYVACTSTLWLLMKENYVVSHFVQQGILN